MVGSAPGGEGEVAGSAPGADGGSLVGAGPHSAPLGEIYAGRRAPLAFRVAKVRAAIAAPEVRIAASIAQLGLAARLSSIALGSAVLHDRIPDFDPARLHWDPDASSPDDLFLATAASRPVPDLAAIVLDQHLAPLAAALRVELRISERLLWGNAGSAVAAAAREIHRWAGRTGHPQAAARARTLADTLFADPRLTGTGTFEAPGFRRRSCCLYYRIPGGGVCGDCCFRTPPVRTPPSPSRRTG
ncbi:(2Fe-2S)-binding protein [Streptomyces sp. TRM66268-LWL]|uniref:(2Fe-2S)-binding protein n=2 Tax=Streptomyces polyasparticus TaxID=2767826 RepID=A0ABR7SHD3_9ACTN|nr:(2Fe-2S)-binding protein [Streptomyces polyasparticus]